MTSTSPENEFDLPNPDRDLDFDLPDNDRDLTGKRATSSEKGGRASGETSRDEDEERA